MNGCVILGRQYKKPIKKSFQTVEIEDFAYGDEQILFVSVSGVTIGRNINIQLATDISDIGNLIIHAFVSESNTVKVYLKNYGDLVTVPTLKFNLYIS